MSYVKQSDAAFVCRSENSSDSGCALLCIPTCRRLGCHCYSCRRRSNCARNSRDICCATACAVHLTKIITAVYVNNHHASYVTFYGTKACPVNSAVRHSLESITNKALLKIFGTMFRDFYGRSATSSRKKMASVIHYATSYSLDSDVLNYYFCIIVC